MMKPTAVFIFLFGMAAGVVTAQDLRVPLEKAPVRDTLHNIPAGFREVYRLPAVKYNYYQSLGAACKVELKLEQATKVPFRFRLGSLQQTDYLEQKPNVQKP